jgi:hypothetical protein
MLLMQVKVVMAETAGNMTYRGPTHIMRAVVADVVSIKQRGNKDWAVLEVAPMGQQTEHQRLLRLIQVAEEGALEMRREVLGVRVL